MLSFPTQVHFAKADLATTATYYPIDWIITDFLFATTLIILTFDIATLHLARVHSLITIAESHFVAHIVALSLIDCMHTLTEDSQYFSREEMMSTIGRCARIFTFSQYWRMIK